MMKLAFVAVMCVALAVATAPDTPFRQLNATIFRNKGTPKTADWKELPFSSPVVDAVYAQPYAKYSPYSVMTASGELWDIGLRGASFDLIKAFPKGSRLAVTTTEAHGFRMFVATSTQVLNWNEFGAGSGSWTTLVNASFGTINSIALQFSEQGFELGHVMVAASSGLWAVALPSGNATRVPLTNTLGNVTVDNDATMVYCLPIHVSPTKDQYFGGRCFASVNEHWCNLEYNQCANTVHTIRGAKETLMLRTPGIIDRRPVAATYDPLHKAVVFAHRICINMLFLNGTLLRIEGGQGNLPQHNLTAAAHTGSERLWLGSAYGAMSREFDGSWRYYFGPRWLPGTGFTTGMHVTAIASSDAETLVATDGGISFLTTKYWTLQEKAALFESHIRPRHDFFGIVTNGPLREFGVLDSWYHHCSANSGLWSSIYLSSQCFRYATTQSAAAKASAWRTFHGMQLLINATGVRGYPARCVSLNQHTGEHWYASPTDSRFWFQGGTSSDEITGHMSTYPLLHDLVAQTDAERLLVKNLINDIIGHIVDHGLELVGAQGTPTEWGRWDPKTLVNNPLWYDDLGLNALQIVSWLSSGYRLTGNETYATLAAELLDKHQYGEHIVNLKVTQMSDVNFSDDELTFLAYLTFFWSCRPSALMQTNKVCTLYRKYVDRSIERTWNYRQIKEERPDLWNVIYGAYNVEFNRTVPGSGTEGCRFDQALWTMRTWPISGIDWPTNNADRLDVAFNPTVGGRMHGRQSITTILPYDEIDLIYWNGNPFTAKQGSGYQTNDMSPWLFPYWMSRYYNFVTEGKP